MKTRKVYFRCTPLEYQMLEHWSASKNLCISEAIREKLFGELLITRMGEEYLERSVKQKEEAKKGRFSHLAK